MKYPFVALFALAAVACNQGTPPPDLCGSPTDDGGSSADANGAPLPSDGSAPTDAAGPMDAAAPAEDGATAVPASCGLCADLSSLRVDQRVNALMGSEFPLFVAASVPGAAPIAMPGALWGASRGALLRAAVAANNVDAVRALADRVESTLRSNSNGLAINPPLAQAHSEETLNDVMITAEALGDACSGALALDGFVGDPSLFSRLRGAAPMLNTVLVRGLTDMPRFTIDRVGYPAYLAVAARMIAACGTLVGDATAAASGLEAIDAMARVQSTDGFFFDAQGRYDTGGQARALVNTIEALRSVPLSGCARRLAVVQSGLRWMASRVTSSGQVDSSGSATTCNAALGALRPTLDLSLVYRSLVMGSALFESDPNNAPLNAAAIKLSVFATMNQRVSTCVP